MGDPGPEPVAAVGFEDAFPRRLRADVRAAVGVIPQGGLMPIGSFRVVLSGEVVTVPYRIYVPEPPVADEEALSLLQRTVLDCLYTRHHDGRVRQRRLERVIGVVEPWVVPFVVRLIGEYVVEIVLAVERDLLPRLTPGNLVDEVYGGFTEENAPFIDLTRQRAASYWNCYHRYRYPALSDYPGHRLVKALEATAARRRAA